MVSRLADFVPSPQEYAAMSWYQRRQLLAPRYRDSPRQVRATRAAPATVVRVGPLPGQVVDAVFRSHPVVLRFLVVEADPDGDRHWNELAKELGDWKAVRSG